ncbi:MAG: hypothetical protein ACQGVC_24810 [Myxococcota bacterium]
MKRRAPYLLAVVLACGGSGGSGGAAPSPAPEPTDTATLRAGALTATVAGNAGGLSGVRSLRHDAAPDFEPLASAALNYEHLIAGRADPRNTMAPRRGPLELRQPAPDTATLHRAAADSPWGVEATLTLRAVAPHYLDMSFRCRFDDPAAFDPHGYAAFFFASYMQGVVDEGLHFLADDDGREMWVRVDGSEIAHPAWDHGGSWVAANGGTDLAFEPWNGEARNLWAYTAPEIAAPFYWGQLEHGMVWAVMFDRLATAEDEIRFALFRFRPGFPAWDFGYVVRDTRSGVCGFDARVVYKPFVSAGDVEDEWRAWRGR